MTKQKYIYLGACSEVVLTQAHRKPLIGYIEKDSEADEALHLKARQLETENYLEDWAAELNTDYFNDELRFKLRWSHVRTRTGGGAKGYTDPKGKVTKGGEVIISYRLAHHAYTETEDCVEYLLMHEMAHMLEMNHYYNFWTIVARNPAAINGHQLYHGKSFPIALPRPTLQGERTYIDARSLKGKYLATGGHPPGQIIKSL